MDQSLLPFSAFLEGGILLIISSLGNTTFLVHFLRFCGVTCCIAKNHKTYALTLFIFECMKIVSLQFLHSCTLPTAIFNKIIANIPAGVNKTNNYISKQW